MGEIVKVETFLEDKKVNEVIQSQVDKKLEMYEGDFKRFKTYCEQSNRAITFDSLEKYLYQTIEQGLKLSTFNRRAAGITYYLENRFNLVQSNEQRKRITQLRSVYNGKEHAEQKLMRGQSAKRKDEVLDVINKLDTRARAISYLNLITACRPSEMIAIQIKHIDLDNHSISVYMQKQSEWKTKRLTLDCVNAIRKYLREYGLSGNDYFVCRTDRHGHVYKDTPISDTAYRKAIHNWLGFAPYSLRKTQITSMHENGADLATIAKQSGHKSLETITKHYLEVNDTTVDKYL
ncbi:tyrosine-type recombinase/integrase [Ureibacillus sp. 179-F W5.1 NHS]|uniref:tyrosine-type recombinase/integrase n=1 Tax=Ureibacillus sp. 179-F W5.1 NHS TaxID=3374297 RepID=UPI003879ED56